jgi:DNA-binding NarL/FixJ family response regulator
LIADDHPLTREGLALAVRAAMPGVTIDPIGTIAEGERAIMDRGPYRCIILDFMLPDAHGYSGFLQFQHLARQTPIVVVSAREEMPLVDAARALGAAGFLFKSRPLDDIATAIRRIEAGASVFPPQSSPSGVIAGARARIESLSSAQFKVLLALADGRLNKQIASDLGVTEATVKAHLTAIFRKLGVTNRTQALLAMQPLLGDRGDDPA